MKALLVLGVMLASAVLTVPCLSAGDKGPPRPALPKGTTVEQVKELIAQHEKAAAAFRKLYEAARTEDEQEKLEALYPDPRPYAELLFQIAEKNPSDSAAVDALVWAYRNGRSTKAKAILMRNHLRHPKIGPFCLALRHENDTDSLTALKKVLSENPSKEAQAHATLALGMRLKSYAALAPQLQKADANALPKWEERLGKEAVAVLQKADAAALAKEAEELMERITKDKTYAQTTIPFGAKPITLGKLAGRELFESIRPANTGPRTASEGRCNARAGVA